MEKKLSFLVFFGHFMIFLHDLNGTYSYIVCDKGIYVNNKTVVETAVTLEDCSVQWGTCEDCFALCSNYTDVIYRLKDIDVNGPFNMSWTIYGDAKTYLMKYGLQQYDGILQMYYAVLHFPETEIPLKTTYRIILQCQTHSFARIRVTLLLPAGNRTTPSFNQGFSTTPRTWNVSIRVSVPSEVKTCNTDLHPSQTNPVNFGVTVPVVVGALVALVFITVAVFYIIRASFRRQRTPACVLQKISNNQCSGADQEVLTLNRSSQQTDRVQYSKLSTEHCNTQPNRNSCAEVLSLHLSKNTTDVTGDNSGQPDIYSRNALLKDGGGQLSRQNFRGNHNMQDSHINPTEYSNVRFWPQEQRIVPDSHGCQQTERPLGRESYSQDQFPLHIQKELQFLNSEI